MANPRNLKPFIHGDPRINRKGRPHSFDQLRKLAVQVAAEEDTVGVTRVLEILRDWAKSKEVAKQDKFMAYTFGKPKEEIELAGKNGEAITLKVVYEEKRGIPDKTTGAAPKAD